MANKETDILAVKLVPGPNGAPLGKVLRVNNIREAAEKHVSTDLRDVTSRYIDVAFDLPVSAVFSTQKAERSIHFANVTLPGSVLLFDKDEDCATLENDSSIAEINDADGIEAWEPVDACEIASGEHYMPALTRPELLLLKTCLKRGGFNLPLEWREMARQLFGRFDAELKGEIQLGTDGQKTN